MATGDEFSATLSGASEFIYEFCCTPCSKDGDIAEAVNQCLDCNEFLCDKCVRVHNKLGGTSGHTVLDGKEMRQAKASNRRKPRPPTQLCKEHGGDRFAVYCPDHDAVCCNTGVSISHKNCDGTVYIVTAAAGITASKQLQTTKTSISSTLKEVKSGRTSRQSYLADLDKDKMANIKHVQEFTEQLVNRIRELERATIEEINNNHKEVSIGVWRDVASLDGIICTMEEDLQKLERSDGNHESQVFLDCKLGQSHESEGQKLLLQLNRLQPCLKFVLKAKIENFMKYINSLTHFSDYNQVYKAKLNNGYNIKIKQDGNTCNITGSCQLPDGTLVITDFDNKRIKRLDASFSVKDHCDMPSEPWGVARTSPNEVAVTMTSKKKVQFVSVGKSMSKTRSFPTSDCCRGICSINAQLYVSCGGLNGKGFEEGPGHLSVYSLKGELMRSIQTDANGQNMLSCPRHICARQNSSDFYVADLEGGVMSFETHQLSRSGTIKDSSLLYAWGICTLENDHVLVCGRSSNNVLQFDACGRKVTELLNDTDGIKEPKSLWYDSRNSRLIVTMKGTDIIKVFDLV